MNNDIINSIDNQECVAISYREKHKSNLALTKCQTKESQEQTELNEPDPEPDTKSV